MPFQEHPEGHLSELLDRVNEMGKVDRLNELDKQGWRVVSVDLTHHPSHSPAAQPSIPLPDPAADAAGARDLTPDNTVTKSARARPLAGPWRSMGCRLWRNAQDRTCRIVVPGWIAVSLYGVA